MASCNECRYYKETLKDLYQCTNPKSAHFHEDVRQDFKCQKLDPVIPAESNDDGFNIMRSRIREKMGNKWNPRELAIESDVAYQTLWAFLAGKSKPRLDTAIKLAVTLDVSLDWLVGLVD